MADDDEPTLHYPEPASRIRFYTPDKQLNLFLGIAVEYWHPGSAVK